MSIPVTNLERETTCNYSYVDKAWKIWSNVPKHINKMKRLCYPVIKEDDYGITFLVPEAAVRFASPEKRKREMTEEQKAAAAERLRLARISGADEPCDPVDQDID